LLGGTTFPPLAAQSSFEVLLEAVAALEQARGLARNRQEALQIGRRIERLRRLATE